MYIEHPKIISELNPTDLTFEESVKTMGEFYQNETKVGQGFFFDMDIVPEFKKAITNWMVHYYGWKLEYDGTFLRKVKE
jgi:hypothetical protein